MKKYSLKSCTCLQCGRGLSAIPNTPSFAGSDILLTTCLGCVMQYFILFVLMDLESLLYSAVFDFRIPKE